MDIANSGIYCEMALRTGVRLRCDSRARDDEAAVASINHSHRSDWETHMQASATRLVPQTLLPCVDAAVQSEVHGTRLRLRIIHPVRGRSWIQK